MKLKTIISALAKFFTNAKLTDKQNSTSEEKENAENAEIVKIEDTPFTAVRQNDKWYLCIGKYRLADNLKSLEDTKEEAKDASWWRLMAIMRIIAEEVYNERHPTSGLDATIKAQKEAKEKLAEFEKNTMVALDKKYKEQQNPKNDKWATQENIE